MGSKRQNTKSSGKAKQPAAKASKAVEAPQVKEPFTLVLYDSIQKKGVVETAKIAKRSRVVGGNCLAPNPIDYIEPGEVDPDASKKFPAKVIAFGYNIDYLYEIPVLLGSDPENVENQQEVAAKKSKSIENAAKTRKKENLIQEDSNVVKQVPLFSQGGSKSTNSVDCCDLSVSKSSNGQPIEGFKSTNSVDCCDLSVSKSSNGQPIEPKIVKLTISSSSDLLSTSDVDDDLLEIEQASTSKNTSSVKQRSENKCDGEDEETCRNVLEPKGSSDQEGLAESRIVFFPFACPEGNSCLFQQVVNSGTEGEKTFLKRVIDAALKHQLDFGQSQGGGSTKSKQGAAEGNKGVLPESMFSCFDPIGKYPLVSGMRIFILKVKLMCLPPIEGQTNKYVKQIQVPAVPVRTIVNKIVDAIIEEDILKENTITCQTLPKAIPETIAAYINMRLDETNRRLPSEINRYITDRCRRFHRDRDLEAAKRLIAEASGQPPKKRPRKISKH